VEVRVVSDGKYSTIPGFVNGATSRHVWFVVFIICCKHTSPQKSAWIIFDALSDKTESQSQSRAQTFTCIIYDKSFSWLNIVLRFILLGLYW
jgi:hypothetical protein